MDNSRVLVSRNRREGYYAGYYGQWHHIPAGHRRWDSEAMAEFYPKVDRFNRSTEARRATRAQQRKSRRRRTH